MKYILALVTLIIVGIILLPVMLVRWNTKGWKDVGEGIALLYGIDD